MFKTVLNWFGSAILISALVVFTGCGGTESGLESEEEVIAVELTPETFTVDVSQSVCETPDEEPEESQESEESEEASANIEELTLEPFFDTLGIATFHYIFYCPTCPPGADSTYIIESYTVEYIPLKSPSGSGGFFYPPELVNLDRPILSQVVLSKDFTTAERSILLVTVQTKEEYVKKMLEEGGYNLYTGSPLFGLYSIRVNFYGRNSAGGPLSFTSTTEVSFGNYDNCSS